MSLPYLTQKVDGDLRVMLPGDSARARPFLDELLAQIPPQLCTLYAGWQDFLVPDYLANSAATITRQHFPEAQILTRRAIR